jgi:hypothetical protein
MDLRDELPNSCFLSPPNEREREEEREEEGEEEE